MRLPDGRRLYAAEIGQNDHRESAPNFSLQFTDNTLLITLSNEQNFSVFSFLHHG